MREDCLPRRTLVIAPHPDDETLGAGGYLSRLRRAGCEVHWAIVTEMAKSPAYSQARIAAREAEIAAVAQHYGFASVHRLGFVPAGLTPSETGALVASLGRVLDEVRPDAVLAPFPGDAHSDHAIVFGAANAAVKSVRRPFVSAFLVYETLSETGFNLDPGISPFRPNIYVRLTLEDLGAKESAMALFAGEVAEFPFPRSLEAIQALARLRGSECSATAAEGFMLLKSVI